MLLPHSSPPKIDRLRETSQSRRGQQLPDVSERNQLLHPAKGTGKEGKPLEEGGGEDEGEEWLGRTRTDEDEDEGQQQEEGGDEGQQQGTRTDEDNA